MTIILIIAAVLLALAIVAVLDAIIMKPVSANGFCVGLLIAFGLIGLEAAVIQKIVERL